MPTTGKLELTIKINEFPADARTVENGWKEFDLDCDGQLVRVKVKPKVFKKLEDAQANYPMWVAAIAKRCCASLSLGRWANPYTAGSYSISRTSKLLNVSRKNRYLKR